MKKLYRYFGLFKINNTLLTILLLALLLRLINLDQSFWLDEAAQVLESARPFVAQWQIVNDFHPPLFHFLVHFWMKGGTSEWYLRLVSVFIGVATVWIVYLIGSVKKENGRYLFGKQVGLWASFLLAINPYHVYYSQELRMYSLSALFAVLLIYAFLIKKWRLHTIALVGGLYTLYLFPLMLIAELFYILKFDRRFLRVWGKSVLFSGLLFVPWLPVLAQQLRTGLSLPQVWPEWKSLSSPGFVKSLPLTYTKFVLGRISFDNKFVYGTVVGLSLLVFVPLLFKAMGKKLKDVWLLIGWLVVPIFVAWIVSLWIPINGPWRMLFVLPALSLLLSIGMTKIEWWSLKVWLASGVVFVSLLGLFIYYGNERFQREDWRGAVGAIHELLLQNEIALVTFAFPEPFAPYRWYARDLSNSIGLLEDLKVKNSDRGRIKSLIKDKKVIYHFEYLSDLSDPKREILKWFKDNGFVLKKTYDFRGVGFVFEYVKGKNNEYAKGVN